MNEVTKLKWFAFNQNNSGGHFVVDANASEYVFIQAANADEAVEIAERFCDNSDSCDCCGLRWPMDHMRESEGTEQPEVYGEHYTQLGSFFVEDWARLHYADGRVEVYPPAAAQLT